MNLIPKVSHFTWLRYLAAFSIMFSHSRQFDTAPLIYKDIVATFTWLFPGVPVLFFISGFLISLSSVSSKSISEFLVKRVLRIYPPLWAAFVISIVLLFTTGMLNVQNLDWVNFILWCLGQITFIFIYHPDYLSHIGTGVLNGSLWAIPIIFQFYLLLPLINKIDTVWQSKDKPYYIYLFLIFCASVNMTFHYLYNTNPNIVLKVIHFLTVLPWLFFFILGYVFSRDFSRIMQLSRHWLPWIVLHLFIFFSLWQLGFRWGRNDINPIMFVVLALSIIHLAYLPRSRIAWFTKLENALSKNDISFGLFVYHMLVLNTISYFGIFEDCWIYRIVSFFIFTILISIFSLIAFEKPINNQRKNLIDFIEKFKRKSL